MNHDTVGTGFFSGPSFSIYSVESSNNNTPQRYVAIDFVLKVTVLQKKEKRKKRKKIIAFDLILFRLDNRNIENGFYSLRYSFFLPSFD